MNLVRHETHYQRSPNVVDLRGSSGDGATIAASATARSVDATAVAPGIAVVVGEDGVDGEVA